MPGSGSLLLVVRRIGLNIPPTFHPGGGGIGDGHIGEFVSFEGQAYSIQRFELHVFRGERKSNHRWL
jgi:hypothetical protein